MSQKGNKRIDMLMVERGMCESRTRAQALIMAGKVVVGDHRVDKPGTKVSPDAAVRIKQPDHPYVSRGGVKLAGALDEFGLYVEGLTVLDVGASTGGFTDCLLRRGVLRVYALDVGRGQLHDRLVKDERVVSLEGVNARHLEPGALPEAVDLATFDLSFISLRLVLGPVMAHVKAQGRLLAMVKPQFEVGREKVGKGGIVRDEELRLEAVDGIERFAHELGLYTAGRADSRLPGADGNRETFLLLSRIRPPGRPSPDRA